MDQIAQLIPSSPLVLGLIALVFAGGNVFAVRLMRYTDGDDDE